jgi:hypothetical protein
MFDSTVKLFHNNILLKFKNNKLIMKFTFILINGWDINLEKIFFFINGNQGNNIKIIFVYTLF